MSKGFEEIDEELLHVCKNVLKVETLYIMKMCKETLNLDVSLTEVHAIAAVGVNERKSMSEIAARLHITVGTATVAINNLAKKGCVKRYKNEKDRRIVKVGLTKLGKKVYSIHESFHQDMAKELIRDLDDEECVVVSKALHNLSGFVDGKYAQNTAYQKLQSNF